MLFKAFGPGPCSEELGGSRKRLLVLAWPLGDESRVRGVRDGAGSSVLDDSVQGSCWPGASRDAAQGKMLSGRDGDPTQTALVPARPGPAGAADGGPHPAQETGQVTQSRAAGWPREAPGSDGAGGVTGRGRGIPSRG